MSSGGQPSRLTHPQAEYPLMTLEPILKVATFVNISNLHAQQYSVKVPRPRIDSLLG